jgi:hypothetical protein
MAIVQNPLIGRSKKKMGNSVFSTQFGKNVLRSKPLKVRNPRTPKQMEQRKNFKAMVYLFRKLVPIINAAYGHSVKGMSPFNKMLSLNMKNAWSDQQIIWPNVKICDNVGSCVKNVSSTSVAGHTLDITWMSNHSQTDVGLAEGAANVDIILINIYTCDVQVFPSVNQRCMEMATVVAPASWIASSVCIFIRCLDYSAGVDAEPKQVFTPAYCGDGTDIIA